jgi:hypothetical protein
MLPLTEMLREINKQMKNVITRMIITKLTAEAIKLNIEKNFGKFPKIGIFGPYPNGGEIILHTVARKVASKCFMAIMGSGFYLPKDPINFHEIAELFPPTVRSLLEMPFFESLLYKEILPSLIEGSTNNLRSSRTNLLELEGCSECSVPTLGYIVDSEVSNLKKDCPLLSPWGKGAWHCIATLEKPCPWQSPSKPPCPFSDVDNVPLIVKRFFMVEEGWFLVALEDIDSIDKPLDDFLKQIAASFVKFP